MTSEAVATVRRAERRGQRGESDEEGLANRGGLAAKEKEPGQEECSDPDDGHDPSVLLGRCQLVSRRSVRCDRICPPPIDDTR